MDPQLAGRVTCDAPKLTLQAGPKRRVQQHPGQPDPERPPRPARQPRTSRAAPATRAAPTAAARRAEDGDARRWYPAAPDARRRGAGAESGCGRRPHVAQVSAAAAASPAVRAKEGAPRRARQRGEQGGGAAVGEHLPRVPPLAFALRQRSRHAASRRETAELGTKNAGSTRPPGHPVPTSTTAPTTAAARAAWAGAHPPARRWPRCRRRRGR